MYSLPHSLHGIESIASVRCCCCFFFCDRILRFGKNMPQSLKSFLSSFNVVAIQNSLDRFRNTLNVRNNSKTSRWFPLIRSATCCDVVNGFQHLRRKFLVLPLAFGTLETYFLPSAFEWSEDGRQSDLLSKILATDFLWQIGW